MLKYCSSLRSVHANRGEIAEKIGISRYWLRPGVDAKNVCAQKFQNGMH
jgi:hypothetical protein